MRSYAEKYKVGAQELMDGTITTFDTFGTGHLNGTSNQNDLPIWSDTTLPIIIYRAPWAKQSGFSNTG